MTMQAGSTHHQLACPSLIVCYFLNVLFGERAREKVWTLC